MKAPNDLCNWLQLIVSVLAVGIDLIYAKRRPRK